MPSAVSIGGRLASRSTFDHDRELIASNAPLSMLRRTCGGRRSNCWSFEAAGWEEMTKPQILVLTPASSRVLNRPMSNWPWLGTNNPALNNSEQRIIAFQKRPREKENPPR
jgi:hypothetical protein